MSSRASVVPGMNDPAHQTVHEVTAPDGRTIRAFDAGARDGAPVILHHGTPMCGRLAQHVTRDAAEHGLRLVTYDRAGYGGSTRNPNLRIGASASDTAAVADHFGFDRFATAGVSGGGPHALAGAALLPGRVVATAVVAGDAPYDAEDLDWEAGMGELNLADMEIMRRGPGEYLPYLRRQADEMTDASPQEMREAMRSLLAPVDSAALTADVAAHVHATMVEALSPGVEGWADESMAVCEPWGFDVTSIDVPVRIWHGAQDLFVPVSHGRWLASHIRGAELDLRESDGHISLLEASTPDVHAWLAARLAGDR
jgi:pimeloyl-ACP methyl ester carboxylesterase